MSTSSFDKNFVISDPEEIDRLIDILTSEHKAVPIDKEIVSDERMARTNN